jgi:hypothetical protein
MHVIQKLAASSILVVLAAACGGADPSSDVGQSATTLSGKSGARGGGKTTTSPVTVAVAPNPVALAGTATVSVWPGGSTQQLFVIWVCTQNGAIVASDRSYELGYAATNEPGYGWSADHFWWTFSIPATSVFTTGPADCVARALTYTDKAGFVLVGQASFSVQ